MNRRDDEGNLLSRGNRMHINCCGQRMGPDCTSLCLVYFVYYIIWSHSIGSEYANRQLSKIASKVGQLPEYLLYIPEPKSENLNHDTISDHNSNLQNYRDVMSNIRNVTKNQPKDRFISTYEDDIYELANAQPKWIHYFFPWKTFDEQFYSMPEKTACHIIERAKSQHKEAVKQMNVLSGDPSAIDNYEDLIRVASSLERRLEEMRGFFDINLLLLFLEKIRNSIDSTKPPPSYESLQI